MAKPLGIRTHMPGRRDLDGFDNLAIIADGDSSSSSSSPSRSITPYWRAKIAAKYAAEGRDVEREARCNKKTRKWIGIGVMVFMLIALTTSLLLKDYTDTKRLNDFNEKMRHTTLTVQSNATTSSTAAPTSARPNETKYKRKRRVRTWP